MADELVLRFSHRDRRHAERLQRLKLWLEIVSVAVAILGGLAALVYCLLG